MENSSRGAMALLALSHTPVEHALYESLLAATKGASSLGMFSLRGLLSITDLNSFSTLRRARAGLISKLSIECSRNAVESSEKSSATEQPRSIYQVYRPEEIFERRRLAGIDPYPREYSSHAASVGFTSALGRVAGEYRLSRREAQVAICCAEGLTNAEIGERLFISDQTVKFHLRHIYVKFGVRRRGELISRLMRHEDVDGVGSDVRAEKSFGRTGDVLSRR